MRPTRITPLAAAALLAVGCGGSGSEAPSHAVGGTVSGLSGTGLSLRLAGPSGTLENLPVTAGATSFQFGARLPAGAAWTVTVAPQPLGPRQTCLVTPAGGTVGAADVALTLTCTTDRLAVGGTVSGLAPGASVTLQNLGGDDLTLDADGPFAFATSVPSGGPFEVTVLLQPTTPAQTCLVTSGAGTVGDVAVSSVEVRCDLNDRPVSGTLSGLLGATGVVLQVNGAFDKHLDADVAFSILTNLRAGQAYQVTVKTQPTDPWQTCQVAGGSGLMGAAGAGGVVVTCATDAFQVGGTVSGLLLPGLTLRNGGGEPLQVDADGSFVFPAAVTSGQPYLVTVDAAPATQACAVTGGEGTVGGAAVADVTVTCGCAPGLGDCGPGPGCETDTLGTPEHCGGCGTACSFPNGLAACNGGACQLAGCLSGFDDCGGGAADGCETDLTSDPAHCGSCAVVCPPPPHAGAVCLAQACGLGACAAGFGDCDGAPGNGCEAELAADPLHCGDCLTACSAPPNAAAACRSGTCGLGACASGFDDCDGSALNGCEADLASDRLHCGACNAACSFPNASGACVARTCALGACDAGFRDCNAQVGDGCEIDTRSDGRNCGACGSVCALAHAQPSCGGGACNTAFCDAGWGDCDGAVANGCEHDVTDDPANCGGCGNACATDRVCSAGSCQLAPSCRDLLLQTPGLASGVRTIDPDGAGPGGPVQVYCDMTFDGGGWTFFAHVDDQAAPGPLFVTDSGTYSTTLADGGSSYGLGGSVYRHLGATELMVSVNQADPVVTLASSLVFYRFPPGALAFTTGPVPCTATAPADLALEWRTLLGSYQAGVFGGCDAENWWPYDADPLAGGEPLSLLTGIEAAPLGTGWGSGMGAPVAPGAVLFNRDSWWYAR